METSREEIKEATRALTLELGEKRPDARDCIRRIVDAFGVSFAQAQLERAKEVEGQGGLMLPDGSGRRTLGGVFFTLVKQSVGMEAYRAAIPGTWVRLKQRREHFERRQARANGANEATKEEPNTIRES